MHVLKLLLAVALYFATAHDAAVAEPGVRTTLDGAARAISPELRQVLAGKPSPWIVKAHDVGGPTDIHKDVPWHLLDKEKDPRFDLPHRGKLGVFNPNADIHWLIGLGVAGSEPNFNPPRKYVDHLVNLAAQEIEFSGLRAQILFEPVTSDTLLAVIDFTNESGVAHTAVAETICTKPVGNGKPAIEEQPTAWNRPVDRYGYGITVTTGRVESIQPVGQDAIAASFEDLNERKERVGSLLCTVAANVVPASRRADPGGKDGPLAGMRHEFKLEPGQSVQLLLALNIHRFAAERRETRNQIVLYPAEDLGQARDYSLNSAKYALESDWPGLVNQSFKWYEQMPTVRLPDKSWTADFCCALELLRGNTWSAQGILNQPWYTFCRVHGNEPYGWWNYGMHAHEHLSTFVANIAEPALSKAYLRGHFQVQKPDGFIQYGVNQSGKNFHEPLATAPLLAGESWNVYLWSGDREFLAQAYQACGPFVNWWRSPERTQSGLQHWRDFIETVRDDKDLATWTATDGAENQAALDLNCYLLSEERILAQMARELGRSEEASRWQSDADDRIAIMRRQLWDAADGVYYGKDLRNDRWAQVLDISTFFPLWCRLATPDQARSIARLLSDPQAFGTEYPVATLATRHMPDRLRGQYHWRGANWVETSWLAVRGLEDYGFDDEAARVAQANCRMVFNTLEKTGHFREFYNSLTGEPSDLTDYIWSSIPAIMIVETVFGIHPTASGLETHPRLPAKWNDVRIDNLHLRGSVMSLTLSRSPSNEANALLNGTPCPLRSDGTLFIRWDDLPQRCNFEMVHRK